MSGQKPGYAVYFAIWGWLMVLLVAGAFIPQLSIPKTQAVLLILAIAVTKAALVILFYMHLKSEKVPVWLVAFSPFFLIGCAGALILAGCIFSG